MIRALGYCIAFAMMFVVALVGVYALLGAFVAIMAFVSWSVPVGVGVLLQWWVFRLLMSIAIVIASLFCLSREAREVVDEFERSFKRSYND